MILFDLASKTSQWQICNLCVKLHFPSMIFMRMQASSVLCLFLGRVCVRVCVSKSNYVRKIGSSMIFHLLVFFPSDFPSLLIWRIFLFMVTLVTYKYNRNQINTFCLHSTKPNSNWNQISHKTLPICETSNCARVSCCRRRVLFRFVWIFSTEHTI